MERRNYTVYPIPVPTIQPKQETTQCPEITTSTPDEANKTKKTQNNQQEDSLPTKIHRTVKNMPNDVLNPSHPLYPIYGSPWLENIERNHSKSKTYMRKEDDPMYQFYAKNDNNQIHNNQDHNNSPDNRIAFSQKLDININPFRRALLSIECPTRAKKASKNQ